MIMSFISSVLSMMSLVSLYPLLIMRLFRCLMSIEQRIRIPPRRVASLSNDFRLTIADCDVFCMSGSGRFFVVCKGWRPTRVTGSWLARADKKYTFECSSYEECISLFLDLSKELLRRIPYYV